jgi:homocitrate synthase NifV
MVAKIIDCTLREGQQASGVYFSRDERRQIIAALGAFGVDEIEIGPAAPDSGMAEIVLDIRQLAPNAQSSVWCRCLERDVELAIADGSDAISISLPISDLHIEKRLHKTRQWALDQVAATSAMVKSAGRSIYLSLGLEDATRADPDFLFEVVRQADACGFDRVRLADTVGIITPSAAMTLYKSLRSMTHMSLGIHAHNDFGMATANEISALEAGADWADASVLGLGERAGIAKLEELGGYLAIRQGHCEYDVKLLAPLVDFVAKITHTVVSPRHPIVGEKLFHCESGIHIDGLSKSEEMYQAFSPALLGQRWRRSLGMKAGASAVKSAMEAMEITADPECIGEITRRMRSISRAYGRALSDAELSSIVAEVVRARRAEE